MQRPTPVCTTIIPTACKDFNRKKACGCRSIHRLPMWNKSVTVWWPMTARCWKYHPSSKPLWRLIYNVLSIAGLKEQKPLLQLVTRILASNGNTRQRNPPETGTQQTLQQQVGKQVLPASAEGAGLRGQPATSGSDVTLKSTTWMPVSYQNSDCGCSMTRMPRYTLMGFLQLKLPAIIPGTNYGPCCLKPWMPWS